MSDVHDVLAMYRRAHCSVARYTLGLSEWAPVKRRTVVRSGLEWNEGKMLCEQLNAARTDKHFGSPVYSLHLENPAESLVAVRAASADYWAAEMQRRWEPTGHNIDLPSCAP